MRSRCACLAAVMVLLLLAVSVMGQDGGATEAKPLPELGEEIRVGIKFGPDAEEEDFTVLEINLELMEELGVPVYPGSIGILPTQLVEAGIPVNTQGLLTTDEPLKAAAYYREQIPALKDITQDVIAAFLAETVVEGEETEAPDPEDVLDGRFLMDETRGLAVITLATTEPGWTVIMISGPPSREGDGAAPEGDNVEPEPVGDPTFGKIPYDENDPFVKVETTKGTMYVELYAGLAPVTAANFAKLVDADYYDGLTFHRIVRGFMIQGGDNRQGGPGWTIDLELSDIKHARGTLSMARTADPNSASAQFFLVHSYAGSQHLDGQYAAFGRVIHGIEVVDAIVDTAGGGRGQEVLPAPDAAEKILSTESVDWQTVKAAMDAAG